MSIISMLEKKIEILKKELDSERDLERAVLLETSIFTIGEIVSSFKDVAVANTIQCPKCSNLIPNDNTNHMDGCPNSKLGIAWKI